MVEHERFGAHWQYGASASGSRTMNNAHPLPAPIHPVQATNANYGVNYGTVNQIAYHDSAASPASIPALTPIPDASHTRNRRISPPDSNCLPGTREKVLRRLRSWALEDDLEGDTSGGESGYTSAGSFEDALWMEPIRKDKRIIWLCGPVGCGKSAISQALAEEFEERGLLLGSFFFFRGSGDRSRIARLIVTLALQMADSIPETRPLVEAALKKTLGLQGASPRVQFHRLICQPLQAVLAGSAPGISSDDSLGKHPGPAVSLKGPFLAIIDGFDECDDREEVAGLIDSIVDLFERNPQFPLRLLVASRVEEHIRARIQRDCVHTENIQDYDSRNDITTLVRHTFEEAAKSNLVIRSYGEDWPSLLEIEQLVNHAGGSFIFITTLLKFILAQDFSLDNGMTPMERFGLALNMNPGLDGLYKRILQRAKHIPHSSQLILAIAFLAKPLAVSSLAHLLDIPTYQVVNALIPLQSIIRIPGDNEAPVTIFHVSFVDFVKDAKRSESVFSSQERDEAPRRLAYRCSLIRVTDCLGPSRDALTRGERDALDYASKYLSEHWGDLPRSDGFRLRLAASMVGNKAASNPHLQILHSAFPCTVDFYPGIQCSILYFYGVLTMPDGQFVKARKFWKLLADWGHDAEQYLRVMYGRPLPKPDPLLHRCMIMHFMRSLFGTCSAVYQPDYIMVNFTYHLRMATISTGEEGDEDEVLAFLQLPYALSLKRLPVHYKHICRADTFDTWCLVSQINARFSNRIDPHPWKDGSRCGNVLPSNPSAVWVSSEQAGVVSA